jgi:hypothetical protein
MRAAVAMILTMAAFGQAPEPAPAPLVYAGKPLRVEAVCTEDDIQSLGLGCTVEQPCAIYLELSTIETGANRIVVAGNLHTETATLSSVLLMSEDGGVTWTEPHPRIKNGSLEQAQFFDLQTGWISGQMVGALARDPTAGTVFVDRGPGAEGGRYALLETRTGGESWSIRTVGREKPVLAKRPAGSAAWRLQPHAPTKSYQVQRKEANGRWVAVASFLVNAGACKPKDTELREPPPEEPTAAPATDAVEVFQVGAPKNAKKATPKKKP